ncbi:MAG: thermopsin family protease, partial [Methanomassiliicoccales archaeon]
MKWKLILSALFAALMLLSGMYVVAFPVSHQQPAGYAFANASAGTHVAKSTAPYSGKLSSALEQNAVSNSPALRASSYIQTAQKYNLPLKYLYIPASYKRPDIRNGLVLPGYPQSPAPMGIGSYGLMNESGTMVAAPYTSKGFNATLNLTSLQPFLLSNDAPSSVSIQLNAVTYDTTLFGVPAYDFWTQNVAFYSARQHYVEFIDNIWNFSSPAILMSSNAIYSHTAFRSPYPTAYIGIGPTYTNVSTPFNLSLVLETAVVGGRDTVFFNYSMTYTNLSSHKLQFISGTFDQVEFNSTTGVLGYSAPPTDYLVTPQFVTPTGFIPWDAEIMIGGPGG